MGDDDDDDWCCMATFVHMVGWMGRATSEGNEAKSKMKHPSDMPTHEQKQLLKVYRLNFSVIPLHLPMQIVFN